MPTNAAAAPRPNDSAPAALQTPRVPPAVHGLQVNFCKNPSCGNFGVPVAATATKGRKATNPYVIVASGKGMPAAKCNCCGEIFPLKSNQGIFEETWRIHTETFPLASCPKPLCENHRIPVNTPKAYHSYGETKVGSKRYRCKKCGDTFSVKPKGINPTARQVHAGKNNLILRMLAGKMPLRRICEAADIAPRVLYGRIDFFHRQALAFLADKESKIPEMDIKRLYIGVDRQDYAINWSRRKDKRNVIISAVASADNVTGYVFGMHPNFDPEMNPDEMEVEAAAIGDAAVPRPHRKFARLWLNADYQAAVAQSAKAKAAGSLAGSIAATYAAAAKRADIEAPDQLAAEDALPSSGGMQVHSEYTLYGHFLHMRRLLRNVGKTRFFLDQDSGMRAACLGAFADLIKSRACDAFYVRISKDLTVDQKRKLKKLAQDAFDEEMSKHPDLTKNAVKLILLKDGIANARQIGQWKDRWVFHPMPSMSEPEKAICYLTDQGDYDDDHLAWLLNKASLHAVDSWFNRLRRRSSMLERPIHSSANRGRVWNGYSAYRPEQISKLLTIYRACHNYVWTSETRSDTPAIRLGLAKAVLDYDEIINFT